MGRCSITDGDHTGGLWGTRGLGWERGGSLKRDGIYVYITMTDLHCCMAETHTTMKTNFL